MSLKRLGLVTQDDPDQVARAHGIYIREGNFRFGGGAGLVNTRDPGKPAWTRACCKECGVVYSFRTETVKGKGPVCCKCKPLDYIIFGGANGSEE